jgi:hypothetical protein
MIIHLSSVAYIEIPPTGGAAYNTLGFVFQLAMPDEIVIDRALDSRNRHYERYRRRRPQL